MSPATKAALESNIPKHCLYLITNKRTFLAIFGVYLMTSTGGTEQAIGVTVFVGSLVGFLLEVPSGFIADTIGHKKALVLARVALLLSTAMYLIGGNLFFFILGSIFLSIGQAFTSGTGIALMHETLTALGRDHEYTKIIGRIRGIGFAIPAMITMTLPFLVTIHLKAPFVVALIIDLIGLFVALSYVTPPVHRNIEELHSTNIKPIIHEVKNFKVLRYILFMAISNGAIGAVMSFSDAYQSFLNIPIIYYGVFWGIGQLLVAFFLFFSHYLKELFTFHQFLLFRLITIVGIFSLLTLITLPWAVVVLFIIVVINHRAFGEILNHHLLQIIKDSPYKATILSIRALFSIMVTGVSALCIGIMIKHFGFQIAFGVYTILTGIVLGGWLLWIHRNTTRLGYSSRPRIE